MRISQIQFDGEGNVARMEGRHGELLRHVSAGSAQFREQFHSSSTLQTVRSVFAATSHAKKNPPLQADVNDWKDTKLAFSERRLLDIPCRQLEWETSDELYSFGMAIFNYLQRSSVELSVVVQGCQQLMGTLYPKTLISIYEIHSGTMQI
jgi:hypothetical protein